MNPLTYLPPKGRFWAYLLFGTISLIVDVLIDSYAGLKINPAVWVGVADRATDYLAPVFAVLALSNVKPQPKDESKTPPVDSLFDH